MKLSPEATLSIVEQYLKKYKSLGVTAKMLNLAGFTAPRGGPIQRGHIDRILNTGMEVSLNSPELETSAPLPPASDPSPALPEPREEGEESNPRPYIRPGEDPSPSLWLQEELGDEIPTSWNETIPPGSIIRAYRGRV